MKGILKLVAIVLTAALFCIHWSAEAEAQNLSSFVSNSGNDNNNCDSPAVACGSFQGALNKTVDGGTVTCVNVGFFGPFQVESSVTIDCAAGGSQSSQFIIINATSKTVTLRNLGLNGYGREINAIEIVAASNLVLENVVVSNTAAGAAGIIDKRAGPGVLTINNSSITGIGGPGILVAPKSGIIGVDLDNVRSANNLYGIAVGSGGRVMIKNSIFVGNVNAGIEGDGGSIININTSQISFNGTGIVSPGNITLSASEILSNSTGISGNTLSYGNNHIVANSVAGTTPTLIPAE
jgi:parallel beta helix pectate lyase-like protein